MGNEVKRCLFSKKTLMLLFLILLIILATCFMSTGWKTYHMSLNSDEFIGSKLSDINYIRNLHGNVFKLWKESLYSFKVLLPILLMLPYIMTYIDERNNKYRYMVNIRSNRVSYLKNKIISTVLCSVFIVIFSEVLAMFIIYLGSSNSNFTVDILSDIIRNNYEYFFLDSPYKFFGVFILIQLLFSVSFVILSFGIASFLRNKFLIIITPFIFYVITSLILPNSFKLSTISDLTNPNFDFLSSLVVMFILFIIGVCMLIYNERRFNYEGVI